jgi:branched-chain amino acid transport system ATP-binding protein
MFLELRNVTVSYGKAEVLREVCLAVGEGEIVTIVGANGAGKSTVLRAISGLKAVASGSAWFLGAKITGLKPHEIVRRGISHVPEGRRILAPLSVMENLEIGAYLWKDRKQMAQAFESMFEHFPVLKERRRQIAGSLSGGEQQMLAIARALMNRPKLIMMDEPSMGLSPIMVDEVGSIVQNINDDGISVVLVEQNARMALGLAHRAYVLEVGRVVLEGDAKSLYEDERVKDAYLGG